MASASLNISVVEKRMLTQTEAANYVGLPLKHFKTVCSVQSVEMQPGKFLWDKRDLDTWIDSMKVGTDEVTQAAILGKLG